MSNVRKKVEAQVVLNVRKKGANVTKNAVNVVKSVVVMNDTTTTVVGMNMVKVNAGIE